jgi:hypothetical protein
MYAPPSRFDVDGLQKAPNLAAHRGQRHNPPRNIHQSLVMETEALKDVEPIYKLAVDCERWYTERIAKLKADNRADEVVMLSALSQRFAAWAAFLGVFAEPNICLDRRLRHHVSIQEQVLCLLKIMERNLAFGMASVDM